MSRKRPPAPPPELPGFTYVELLGSGGFADVYLYEQQLPKRRVAVKVLLADRLESSGAQFAAEANVMAMLSTHPAIVTIYQAGMSGDGRPYIVMEYCPRPNLQARYRREPFSVAETLRVAIPVAAAVETAHRGGVLHRDIKPANILVTEYNRPALTDFGIASNAESAADAVGMSIPWSPPESFAEPPRSGRATDVYQLGATIYTLLAGRSPFEIPGQRNSSVELIDRIERMPLPRIDRADVPASLQDALARAMAKRPEDRYPSAVAFARALQKVQIELAHAVTPIDILDDNPIPEIEDEDDGLTRVRNVMSIAPSPESQTRPSAKTHRVDPRPDVGDATVLRAPGRRVEDDDATVLRPAVLPPTPTPPAPARVPGPHAPAQPRYPSQPSPPGPAAAPEPERRTALRWPWFVAAGVVVAATAAVVGFGIPAILAPPEATEAPPTSAPQDPVAEVVPEVEDLTGTVEGAEAVFTWTNPDPRDGDLYLWRQDIVGEETAPEPIEEATVRVPMTGERTCIEVSLRRVTGQASQPVSACAPE